MYLSILFAYATFSRLNRGYTQPKFAPVFAQTCHGKFTCCHRVAVVLNFFPMFCFKAPRALREKNAQQTTGASDCWGNLSPLSGQSARACGYPHEVLLCKKHFDEQSRFNQFNCCFPLVECGAPCNGTLVKCPLRLFPVFDSFRGSRTGTLICEGHLTLADKDQRIIVKEEYTPPKKVRQLQRFIFKLSCLLLNVGTFPEYLPVHPAFSINIFPCQRPRSEPEESQSDYEKLIKKVKALERENAFLVKKQKEKQESNIKLQMKLEGGSLTF